MMSDYREQDRVNRQKALALRSFIVEAPAGAGKTELLTQRYLKLLGYVQEPEEIIAITFTKKAAAEMKSRILESLSAADMALPLEEQQCGLPEHKQLTRQLAYSAMQHAQRQGWLLLQQPERLRVMTVDALVSTLVGQMPVLSRLGAQPEIAESPNVHYREAVRRVLHMLEGEDEFSLYLQQLLQHLDNNIRQIGELLEDMLERRDQWLGYICFSPSVDEQKQWYCRWVEGCLQEVVNGIPEAVQQKLMPLVAYALEQLAGEPGKLAALQHWHVPLTARLDDLPRWQALGAFLLTEKGQLRKKLDKREGFPPTEHGKLHKQAFFAACAEIVHIQSLQKAALLPEWSQVEQDLPVIEALRQVLKLAVGHLLTAFSEAREVDFIEMAHRALQALGSETEPTDLALRLDYRIRHLLVDEFQDTSPTQVQLLQRITAGWSADDGHTLFCVGDPMQSIYRFRKADVRLFLQAEQRGIGNIALEVLQLRRNNRSADKVVDWVNQVFSSLFPSQDDPDLGATCYRASFSERAHVPDAGVWVHPLALPKGTRDKAVADLEAQAVITLVQQERQRDPEGSIAVLVRARDHLQALIAQLRRDHADIPFQAVDIEALAHRQVVHDILSLTRALLHRADRVHWLAILRAPWCGLTFQDLHVLVADDHHATVWQLMQDATRIMQMSESGRERLLALRAILAHAFQYRGRQPLARWVASVWWQLSGPQCLWESADIEQATIIFELIERLSMGYRLDLTQLDQEIARLFVNPAISAEAKLKLMTIHGSKGLEFDTVIVMGMGRDKKLSDRPLLLWEEIPSLTGQMQLLVAPIRFAYQERHGSSLYRYLLALEQERAVNERTRVLYVAATRAKTRLHVVGTIKTDEHGEALYGSSDMASIGQVCPEVIPQVLPEAPADGNLVNFEPWLRRIKTVRHGSVESDSLERAMSIASRDTVMHAGEAACGTLAHRYMEIIAREGLEYWPESRVSGLTVPMQAWLQRQHLTREAAQVGAERVVAALRTTLCSSAGRWVLQAHGDARNEWACTVAEAGEVVTRVIDRTFIAEGVRWIIDYKLGESAQSDTAVLQSHAMRYRDQLHAYARLFLSESLPIQCAILFLSSGVMVEIIPNG